jgi:hypothetical protein
MDKLNYKGFVITIIILLMVVVFQYFTLNQNKNDFNSKINTLKHINDSLLLNISKNDLKIKKMDSLANIYESRVDSSKNKLADLQVIANQNKQKYNEERNRLINLSNKSIVGEFTNAFKH